MNHHDHVFLIRRGVIPPTGIPQPGGVWAEFGSGSGPFTLALAECLGPGGRIYSVDKDRRALARQTQILQERYPQVQLTTIQADFTRHLDLPELDGVLAANALHFLRDKTRALTQIRNLLKPDGRLIVVEYNVDRGNLWVPYPFSYPTWEKLARENGFSNTELLATRPSSFLREFYSALSTKSI